MKTVYVCEKCGAKFDDFSACLDHEGEHIQPIAYSGIQALNYSTTFEYPRLLLVDMSDGSRASYLFHKLVKDGADAETEHTPELATV